MNAKFEDKYPVKHIFFMCTLIMMISFALSTCDYKPKPVEYKIDYHLNGGINNPNNPTTYTEETPTFDLLDANKLGYNFINWTDYYGQPRRTIEKGSKGDITVSANWNIDEYQVKYDLDGGINNPKNPVSYTIEDNLPLYAPTKTGFKFVRWVDPTGAEVSHISKGTTGQFRVTAIWEINYYNVHYVDLEDGTNDPRNPSLYTVLDTPVTIYPAERTGYTFTGWKNDDGATIDTIPAGSTGDITLHATWSIKSFDLTYLLGGGSLKGHYQTKSGATTNSYGVDNVASIINVRDPSGFAGRLDDDKNTFQMAIKSYNFGDEYRITQVAMPGTMIDASKLDTSTFGLSIGQSSPAYAEIVGNVEKRPAVGDIIYFDNGALPTYEQAPVKDFKWKFTVYHDQNASGGFKETYTYKTKLTKEDLGTPYRIGYNFDTWLVDGVPATEVEITSNKTIEAQWTSSPVHREYTVNYHLNGGFFKDDSSGDVRYAGTINSYMDRLDDTNAISMIDPRRIIFCYNENKAKNMIGLRPYYNGDTWLGYQIVEVSPAGQPMEFADETTFGIVVGANHPDKDKLMALKQDDLILFGSDNDKLPDSATPITSFNKPFKVVAVPDSKSVIYPEGSRSLPTPLKAGSNFLGYYLEPDFSGAPITTVSGDTTVYAKWSPRAGSYRDSRNDFIIAYGIDVNRSQENVNWDKYAAASSFNDFAILKIGGWVSSGSSTVYEKQAYFDHNAQGIIKNNIPCGVYMTTYAKNASLLRKDFDTMYADLVASQLINYKLLQYPVFLGLTVDDSGARTKEENTAICVEWTKLCTEKGLFPGIELSGNTYLTNFIPKDVVCDIWIFDFKCGTVGSASRYRNSTDPAGKYRPNSAFFSTYPEENVVMWQYSTSQNEGQYSDDTIKPTDYGVPKDSMGMLRSYVMIDFPTIIKKRHYNGF